MKYLICLLFLVSMAVSSVLGIAGQSACRDPSEVGHTYPNYWDSSKYWHCEKFNAFALEVDCPKGEVYMHLLMTCIPWPNYILEIPENLLTVA